MVNLALICCKMNYAVVEIGVTRWTCTRGSDTKDASTMNEGR